LATSAPAEHGISCTFSETLKMHGSKRKITVTESFIKQCFCNLIIYIILSGHYHLNQGWGTCRPTAAGVNI